MWRNISVAITSGYGRILSVSIWAILPILFIVLTIVGLIPSLADIASNSQEDFLPDGAEFHALADTGHFVHIERPGDIAALAVSYTHLTLPTNREV